MAAEAIERLEAALGEAAGADVELERPSDAAHGDYATNVAMRLAGARQAAAARDRGGARRAGERRCRRSSAPRSPAPASSISGWRRDWYGDALAEILAAGDAYGGGSAAAKERIQVEMVSANPTGPITVAAARNGAYGDSVARLLAFAGHDVEREYYYNDAGAQMDRFRASVEARRRGEEPPEDGYQGDYVAELAKLPDDPVPQMLQRIEATMERFRIHFDSWAKQSELERRLPEFLPRLDTYEKDGAVWARVVRVRRRRRPRPDPLRDGHADLPRRGRRLPRRQARPRPRPRDLRARRRPPRHAQLVRGGRADARLRPRARRGPALPARPPDPGRRGGEDVEAARRRRLPRRVPRRGRRRRGALVPRLARAGPDDRDRRRPRGREDGEEPRLLRPVRARPDRRDPPQRRGRRAVGASRPPSSPPRSAT